MNFTQYTLIGAGVIHTAPIIGVWGASRLSKLYGVQLRPNSSLAVLMQHRAVMLGLLGGYQMYAAARPVHQVAALSAGIISDLSYILLVFCSKGDLSPEVRKVAFIDSGLLLTCAVALGRLQGLL